MAAEKQATINCAFFRNLKSFNPIVKTPPPISTDIFTETVEKTAQMSAQILDLENPARILGEGQEPLFHSGQALLVVAEKGGLPDQASVEGDLVAFETSLRFGP